MFKNQASGQNTGCLTPMICITETARQMFVHLLSCKELLREGALFCAFRRAPKAHHTPSSGEISSVQLVFGKMQ